MKNRIDVVALGPGPEGMMTLGAAEALKRADHVLLRTGRHGAADWLNKQGIPFETLDALYETAEDFDDLAQKAAAAVREKAQKGSVAYGVSDPSADESVRALLAGSAVHTVPGVTASAALCQAAGVTGPYIACAAAALSVTGCQHTLVITEINDRQLAGDVKLKLMPWYGEDAEALFFAPSGQTDRAYQAIPLCELDRQKRYDHTAGCIVRPRPLPEKKRFDAQDLLNLMRILRSDKGCPWDRKQTHQSLRPYLIEEAYETALAIDEGDGEHMSDELGDVLLQIALHAVIGEQYGTMEWTDITTNICRKMIARHRHIFGEDHCDTAEQVADNWSRIKQEERGFTTKTQELMDIKKGLPPLLRAEKVQKKAREAGFDWDDPLEALQKVEEEAGEVRAELRAGRDPREEIGDLLFAAVNTARLAHVSSEEALTGCTEKFIKRFSYMENEAKKAKKALQDLTIDEMSVYWERSKSER